MTCEEFEAVGLNAERDASLGEVQRAMNLVLRIGFQNDRQLAGEDRSQLRQRRVERRSAANSAGLLERRPGPLIKSGVQQGLPAMGDVAHQHARIIWAGVA